MITEKNILQIFFERRIRSGEVSMRFSKSCPLIELPGTNNLLLSENLNNLTGL